MTAGKVHVAILDDHQSIIDGLAFRLSQSTEIEVVSSALYGDDLEPMLERHPIDVLLLDLRVRTSSTNPETYPILPAIPKLLQKYPAMKVLVISMMADSGAVKVAMESGASGYILKDDQTAFMELDSIIMSVANEGIYFSKEAYNLYVHSDPQTSMDILTPRQIEVLSLCDSYPDLTTADFAMMMSVTNSTVRNLLSSAYLRLGVHSRGGAIERAHQLGLLLPRPSNTLT